MASQQSDNGLLALFPDVVEDFIDHVGENPVYMMINILLPQTHVPIHTDTTKTRVSRWHLPVKTNQHAYMWDEVRGMRHFQERLWYPFDHTVNHTIFNLGLEERIHIVVDSDGS